MSFRASMIALAALVLSIPVLMASAPSPALFDGPALNPYCGKVAGDFPQPPDPPCPDPAVLDHACLTAALPAYQAAMAALAAAACSAINTANDTWSHAMDVLLTTYNGCMAAASTPAAKAACRADFLAQATAHTEALNVRVAEITGTYDAGAAALDAGWGTGCCHMPGGGGTGGH